MLLFLFLIATAGAQFYLSDEQFMSPMQLITHRGYPAEEHTVTTPDGYILTMHRIPHGRLGHGGGRPVLLQPGLVCSSYEFLTQRVDRSLSYSLANAGYDVWIGNNRGNIFSDKHVRYSNFDSRFWNFTWDEMSVFDYPATINYVLNVTRQPDLYLVGYSQGGHTFFTSTTARPDIQAKVKHFFALAPSLSIRHVGSTVLQLLVHSHNIVDAGLSVMPNQVSWLPLVAPLCGSMALSKIGCRWAFDEITGPIDQVDDSQLPLLTAHFPAGTSSKNWRHYLQMADSGTKYFDYGAAGNLAAYGTSHPRAFNFSRYSVPTSIYFSPADKLVSAQDIGIALTQLPASAIVKTRNLTSFGHFEFVWGRRAKAEIYDEIIADINKMERR